jgi:hypothetical protein
VLIQTATSILDPLAAKHSAFGALRSDNTVNRCFARDATDQSGPSYPMPLAISLDAAPRLGKLSLPALKLKHALLFLSWNLLHLHPRSKFEISGCELSTIVSAKCPLRTAQLREALRELFTVRTAIRTYLDLANVIQLPMLESYGYQSGRFKWQCSEVVEDWCTEPASFAWIDLGVIRQFRSRFALGLYEIGAALVGRNRSHILLSHEELRLCLAVEASSYAQRSDFKKRIIASGLEELNSIAPFSMTMAPASRRRDRQVDGYKVTVQRNPIATTDFRAAPLAENEWRLVGDEVSRNHTATSATRSTSAIPEASHRDAQ